MREPNSHECIYYGRKLSNVVCDIEARDFDICIGSYSDDSIYFNECLAAGEEMLKERVMMSVEGWADGEGLVHVEIDLEDILRFSAKNCRGIYERVLKETREEE